MKTCFNNLAKVFFVSVLVFSIVSMEAFAQKWVSTKVEKRSVLLEEYTGIYCQYCPDGHKRANNLKNQYPGKVVLVNIHAGVYANPGPGDLDLRTPVGTAVDAFAKVTGYPAGSVNRSTNPMAIDRGQWANAAAQVLSQDSPVNIAAKAVYDGALGKIKTDVEIYYTGNPAPGDKVQVYFIQDSVLGGQTGGTTWYPENFKNGQYIHNHILRMSADGSNWGATINGAEKGKLITQTLITDVPNIIGNVPTDLSQFRVVAFVVQANNAVVYTATEDKVTSGIIDPSILVDLSVVNLTEYPKTFKREAFTPKLEITNNSEQEVTKFDVYFEMNGKSIMNSFSGSLKKGDKTVIEWPSQTSDRALATVSFKGVYDLNDGLVDATTNEINNESKQLIQYKADEFSETLIGFDGSMPEFSLFVNEGHPFSNIQNSSNPIFGANGTTGGWITLLDPNIMGGSSQGRNVHAMFGGCDLTGKVSAELKYYYAFSFGTTSTVGAPTVRVEISEDWGTSWYPISAVTCEDTGPGLSGMAIGGKAIYAPLTTDYKPVTVDLKNYLGKQFLIRVSAVPGMSGSTMWIDEISVSSQAMATEGAKISVSSTNLKFGLVDLNQSVEKTVTISNTGDETLNITNMSYNNPDNVFTLAGGQPSTTIEPGQSMDLTLKFSPKDDIEYNGSVTLSTNAKNDPVITVLLSGTGNDPSSVAYGATEDGNFSMKMTPNPVVSSSQLNYTITNDNSNVRLYLMDITGKVLSELVNTTLNSGTYNLDFSSANYVSGTYYIMAEVNGSQAQIPVVIAK